METMKTWQKAVCIVAVLFFAATAIVCNNKPGQAPTRDEKVAALFSSWDGSCKMLVEYVKEHMKNPDSFEHVKTQWVDLMKPKNPKTEPQEVLLVWMTCRGTNSFGGIVPQQFQAKINTIDFTMQMLTEEQFIDETERVTK